MAFQIEQVSRDVAPQRIVPNAERTVVVVRPGDAFRFVDDVGAKPPTGAPRVRRVGNNLVIDELPDGKVIELQNFFGACRPGAECSVSLEGLGAPAGTVITEETAPSAALSDGSFLIYSTDPSTAAALPTAAVDASASGGGLSPGMIGAIGGGVLLVGAAAGGGGGGGGGGGSGVDTTAPPAPVITSGSTLKLSAPVLTGETEAGARVTVRLDLNGNGLFTDPADLTYVTSADADGRWRIDLAAPPQFGVPPAGGFEEGRPYAALVQASDAAGNASGTATQLTFDGTPPRAPVIDVIAGDDTVNAAERAQGVTVGGTAEAGSTVTVALGSTQATATAASSGTWSAYFEPGLLPNAGLFTVTAVATDPAGNTGPASATRQIVFETTVPGAPVITDDAAGTATSAVTFTVTFDKPVTGVTIDDILVEGGTKGAFTPISQSVYTLVVTPFAGVQQGQIVLQLPEGAGADLAGNPTSAASPVIQAYDTLRPSVAVTENAPALTNAPVTFTFEFSEAVTGFVADDVSVSGGAKGPLVGSGTTYSMVVTPTPGATGSIVVTVAADVAVDAVGLGNTALPAPVSVAFDTAAPTLAITDDAEGPAGGPVTYTFTFGEAVSGFEQSDIDVTGVPPEAVGTLSGSGATYTLVITPPANTSGSIGVSVAAGAAVDAVGNASPGASAAAQTFNTDTSLPTLTITDRTEPEVTNAPVTFVLTFSEPVQAFDQGDIRVTGGTPGTLAQDSDRVYTLAVTPTANATGTVAVSVEAGAFTDLNGNTNPAGASGTQSFDTQAPALTRIDSSAAGVTATGPVTFTFTTSEAVIGFTSDDVAVTGGTVTTAFAATGATTYALTVTPTADSTDSIGIAVDPGKFADGAGNTNTAGASLSQAYDTEAPRQSVTLSGVFDNEPGPEESIVPGGITDDATPRFAFTLDAGLSTGDIITLARDGTTLTTFTSGTTFDYQETLPLTEGPHEYTATIADSLGNARPLDLTPSTDGPGYAFTFTPPLLPPV